MGHGTLKAGKKVAVTSKDGSESEYEANHVIIATGARFRNSQSSARWQKKSSAIVKQ